jgi:D-serine ammonia-lyase
LVYIKVDIGGRRAGVVPGTDGFAAVVDAVLATQELGHIELFGLYSHAGHSYGGKSEAAAMSMLNEELSVLSSGIETISEKSRTPVRPLTISVGATPTALSVQNLLDKKTASTNEAQLAAQVLNETIAAIRRKSGIVEIHAGVYPLLDLQQLAAHSNPNSSWSSIGFTVVAEVLSIYPGRGTHGTPEALIGAGGLALGREFCKAYPGMAIVTPWNRPGARLPTVDVEKFQGWHVDRFAQEHGILGWLGAGERANGAASMDLPDELEVGQKIRLWPNHACITSSHFGWYFVVDSSRTGKEDEIVDIWVKTRGW